MPKATKTAQTKKKSAPKKTKPTEPTKDNEIQNVPPVVNEGETKNSQEPAAKTEPEKTNQETNSETSAETQSPETKQPEEKPKTDDEEQSSEPKPPEVEPKVKAKKNDSAKTQKENSAAKDKGETEKPKRVRVICKGTLGHKLLETGAITDDPEYVALLEVSGQKKVEEVK
jgi:hypothetical protein